MNDSTRTQLKIMVERAVRPVRASFSSKRKMREELLAHVLAVFEEETAKLSDEQNALARTGQRFGNAAELTKQLQASVSWHDKGAWYFENFFKKPGTSPWYPGQPVGPGLPARFEHCYRELGLLAWRTSAMDRHLVYHHSFRCFVAFLVHFPPTD